MSHYMSRKNEKLSGSDTALGISSSLVWPKRNDRMEGRFSGRGTPAAEAPHRNLSTHERGELSYVPVLTLTRRLAGRGRREWWRFRCRDGCHVRVHAR